jgi:ankyrin repeat protein
MTTPKLTVTIALIVGATLFGVTACGHHPQQQIAAQATKEIAAPRSDASIDSVRNRADSLKRLADSGAVANQNTLATIKDSTGTDSISTKLVPDSANVTKPLTNQPSAVALDSANNAKKDLKNALLAVKGGPDGIKAFHDGGGKFTDEQDQFGNTAAMIAARMGANTIKAFHDAGGFFTDKQDEKGWTAAMQAAGSGLNAMKAFVAAGGQFTNQENEDGVTAAQLVVGANAIKFFNGAVAAQNSLLRKNMQMSKADAKPVPH